MDQGYEKVIFQGKEGKKQEVLTAIAERGLIPETVAPKEVSAFFDALSIDDVYFELESVDTIVSHVESLYGQKLSHFDQIKLEKENENDSVYIYSGHNDIEKRIDEKYLDTTQLWRLESYTSKVGTAKDVLRSYFVYKTSFIKKNIQSDDIRAVSDAQFLSKATQNTLQIYQEVMKEALNRMGPVATAFQVDNSSERRVVIAYKSGTTTSFFSALSDLYHEYGFYSTRKYVEHFSNGITIICMYLHTDIEQDVNLTVSQIIKEISLVYILPNNPFFSVSSGDTLSIQESVYAYSAWIFAQHFLNRLGSVYTSLKNYVDESDSVQATILSNIRARLREETFTRASILESMLRYPGLIRLLYISFAVTHHYSTYGTEKQLMPTLSYSRVNAGALLSNADLLKTIKKETANAHDALIFESFVTFNESVLKTNFFTPTKVAISFRLDPSFVPEAEYPSRPFGIFLVVGNDFRGFHVRFKDVARGGIRVVRSRNKEAYSINQRNLFDENYGLASTQALKNKDIPEGGSKGVILPDLGADPEIVFQKYVDALIDLLIPGQSPGIKEQIVDLYKKPEILFLGPDEGTATFMDWAAQHAKQRGAPWWKSFTTGKTASTMGGIPHDVFGMTSLSIRSYTTGIYRKVGVREEDVTKVMTGGPDGDLGSNEILLSKDKTIAIIDGSGVLYDPQGLDRAELVRLARRRVTANQFDTSKLSSGGYFVSVDDHDVTLPLTNEVIADGTDFRNGAHLRFKADILVPCGGRPESINITNVDRLWDDEGVPNFKYIVEGANLFITQSARLALERKGVILYRDSSANKGGVTSSSLEVLVGMSLDDAEFMDLMTQNGDEEGDEGETEDNNFGFHEFYVKYVQEIQRIISANATAEFDVIWREHAKTGRAYTLISDELSQVLIKLQSDLEESNLFADATLRRCVMQKAIPQALIEEVGLDTILSRLPANYETSIFASYIASRYIYKYGLSATNVDFYYFIEELKR